MAHDFVTLVSGLPRSGTSMMMKMLEAGDARARRPRADGGRGQSEGYYESERVKKTETDSAWLDEAHGRVVR